MSVKLTYNCNYNGWDVYSNDEITEEQVEKLEEELPSLSYELHDEDGYNEEGLYGDVETKVNDFIKSIVGDVPYEIDENFFNS
jgi:hypothetical protein